ncbi:MAG: hypothetical protein ACE3JQ_03670 [Paenisporosarcina sp.]
MNIEIKKRLEAFKNKEIPEGYKKVQRFTIPKDWEFTEIKNVATQVSILKTKFGKKQPPPSLWNIISKGMY